MSEWHQELRLGWLSTHLHLLINCFSDILASHLMYIMTFLHSVLKHRLRKSFCSFLSLKSRCDILSLPTQRDSCVSFVVKKELLTRQVLFERQTSTKNRKFIFPMFLFISLYGFFSFFFNSGGYSVIFCLIYQTHSSSPNCRAIDLSLTCQWQFLFDNKKYFKYIWKEREERK